MGAAKNTGGSGSPSGHPSRRRVTPPTPSTLEKAAVSAEQVAEPRKADSERLIAVETDLFKITLSNREAVVKSWILKKYSDSDGKPLDLILAKNADIFGYPLSLKVDKEEEVSKRLSNALFFCDANGDVSLTTSTPSRSITFEFADQEMRVQKRLTFSQGSYAVRVQCLLWLNNKPD